MSTMSIIFVKLFLLGRFRAGGFWPGWNRGVLEITSKKTSTSSTAVVSKAEISGNLTDTRKWESCTN